MGGAAGADDPEGVAVAVLDAAPDVEQEGGVGEFPEGGGPGRIVRGDDLDAALGGVGEFGGKVGVVLPSGNDPGGVAKFEEVSQWTLPDMTSSSSAGVARV